MQGGQTNVMYGQSWTNVGQTILIVVLFKIIIFYNQWFSTIFLKLLIKIKQKLDKKTNGWANVGLPWTNVCHQEERSILIQGCQLHRPVYLNDPVHLCNNNFIRRLMNVENFKYTILLYVEKNFGCFHFRENVRNFHCTSLHFSFIK